MRSYLLALGALFFFVAGCDAADADAPVTVTYTASGSGAFSNFRIRYDTPSGSQRLINLEVPFEETVTFTNPEPGQTVGISADVSYDDPSARVTIRVRAQRGDRVIEDSDSQSGGNPGGGLIFAFANVQIAAD